MAEYIEREAAKLRIFEYGVRHRDNSSISFACENLERQMNSIPAADVRPVVKSKWADNHVSFYRGCPECGAFVRANLDEVFLRDFPSAVGKLNFCPNCGADMREEQKVKKGKCTSDWCKECSHIGCHDCATAVLGDGEVDEPTHFQRISNAQETLKKEEQI